MNQSTKNKIIETYINNISLNREELLYIIKNKRCDRLKCDVCPFTANEHYFGCVLKDLFDVYGVISDEAMEVINFFLKEKKLKIIAEMKD
jgi:hypothetical protein